MISAPFHLFSLFGGILSVFLGLLIFAAVIAVLFLLIRFLIVGTHAAQLYVAKNAPAPAPVAPAPAAAPSAPAEPAASSVVPPSAPATPTTAPASPAATAPAAAAPADDSVVFEEVFASAAEPTTVSEPIVGELELETGVAKVTPTRATRAGTTKTTDAAGATGTPAAKKPATRTPRATPAKPAAGDAKPATAPRPRTRKTPPPTA